MLRVSLDQVLYASSLPQLSRTTMVAQPQAIILPPATVILSLHFVSVPRIRILLRL